MPNVTPHPSAGVLSTESYEASESRNEKARFKHPGRAGQVVEAGRSDCCGQPAGKGMGRLKDGG